MTFPRGRFVLAIVLPLALGLPIDRTASFIVVFAAWMLILFGPLRLEPRRLLLALVVLAVGAVAGRALAPPPILEGFGVYLHDGGEDGQRMRRSLPGPVADALESLRAGMVAGADCAAGEGGCWRGGLAVPAEAPFVFSGDGALVQTQGFSRVVRGLDIGDPSSRFAAALNGLRHNIFGLSGHNLERGRLPVYGAWRFSPEDAGARLCWVGALHRVAEDGAVSSRWAETETCQTLGAARAVWYAHAATPDRPFSLRLERPGVAGWVDGAGVAAALGAALLALAVLVDGRRPRALWLPALAVGGTLAWAMVWDLSHSGSHLLGGLTLYRGGGDGLIHDAFARLVLERWLAGDVLGALEGGEGVFVFQPGLRYALALFKVIFGETHFGYLVVAGLGVVAIHRVLREIVTERWAIGLTALFASLPFLERFGFSLMLFIYQIHNGHAETLGIVLFLWGLVGILAVLREKGPEITSMAVLATGLAFAAAIATRPNFAPPAAVALAFGGLALARQRRWRGLAMLVAGAGAVVLVPLHNLLIGGEPVLLSRAVNLPFNLLMPPSAYLEIAGALWRGEWEAARPLMAHMALWNAPSEFYRPLALFAALAMAVHPGGGGAPLRMIAMSGLAAQAVLLFYNPNGRYAFLAWLLCVMALFGAARWAFRRGSNERASTGRAEPGMVEAAD